MRLSNSKGVDLGPAQERVIQAAKAIVKAGHTGPYQEAWGELMAAVKELHALEDSIGGHQQ